MRILGIGGLLHDPSVALLADGKIRMAVESEKVTRHKYELSSFPQEAVRFVLEETGTELREVDYIATNWRAGPLVNGLYVPHLIRFARRNCYPWIFLGMLIAVAGSHRRKVAILALQERGPIPRIVPIRHHLAHLGSCYTLSPFDEAAVAIIDGAGELGCTSLYQCQGAQVKKLYSMDVPLDSLGHIYAMATAHLGYRFLGDEYKVMGLAAYGERTKRLESFFRDLIRLTPEGRYRVDGRLAGHGIGGYTFPEHLHSRIGRPRRAGDQIRQEHMDFARALQSRVEEAILHVIRHLKRVTKSRYLCLAGGVTLNAVANGRIHDEVDFDDIFIQPAAHDAGTALGAAAYLQYHQLKRERPAPFDSPYLGPAYGDEFIRAELRRVRVSYQSLVNPAKTGAELLAQGKVVGWFQGAAEFGPRALGNRSILADPRQPEMKDRVNKLVKEREGYRPFAPAILEEMMETYFERLRRAPYMVIVGTVRPERRATIPAVVHVDGTARPQSVNKQANPLFHQLIDEFRQIAGVPVVLNTSFNVAGEPIVMRPVDAVRCFYGCGLDALIIGSCLLEKTPS
jgi:carbamoyltransferase